MKAKKFKVDLAELPPVDEEIVTETKVDTMASQDAANREEMSLSSAKKIRLAAKDDVLHGRRLIEVKTHQLFDVIGTDRISIDPGVAETVDQVDLESLKNSILEHGQQNAVIIRPRDPRWVPRSDDPTNVEGIEFELLAGRRRRLAIEEINKGRDPDKLLSIHARIAYLDPEATDAERELHALQHRFVENNERHNLTAFQAAVSGGRLIASYKALNHSAEQIEKALKISHTTRQAWAKVYDMRDEVKTHFKGRDPSFEEMKAFVNGGATAVSQKAAEAEKTVGERGFFTLKPARKKGHVAMQLKLTLNEEHDLDLIERLKEAIGQPK